MQESGMILEWVVQIALGIFGAALVYAGLARKVYNLQCDLATTQAQLLKEKNSRAATIRHQDKASLQLFDELKQPTAPVPPKNPLAKFGIAR